MTQRHPHQSSALLAQLTQRDLAILEDIERFRLLTTGQIRRLQFAVDHVSQLSATRGAVRVLGRLEQHGLVTRLGRRIGGATRGSSASIWQLAATGERLLRARRGDPIRRRFQEPSLTFAAHQLEVSELAVRVREAARERGFYLLALDAEPATWRSYVSAAGGLAWIKPDLAVVTADEESETHAWVEVDRATEHLPAVRRKSALYQRYYETGSEQARRGVFPAVVWSVPDEHRARQVRRAIADDGFLDDRLFIVRPSSDVLEVLVPPDPSEDAAARAATRNQEGGIP